MPTEKMEIAKPTEATPHAVARHIEAALKGASVPPQVRARLVRRLRTVFAKHYPGVSVVLLASFYHVYGEPDLDEHDEGPDYAPAHTLTMTVLILAAIAEHDKLGSPTCRTARAALLWLADELDRAGYLPESNLPPEPEEEP